MIVKVASDEEGDNIIKGYEGIKYAVDQGAKIINCSWGGKAESHFGRDIINYAISKGCLVVAAAGNSNSTESIYPAAYKGVLAVANVGASDMKNQASNFGNYISISAPGTSIFSTLYFRQQINSYMQTHGGSATLSPGSNFNITNIGTASYSWPAIGCL